MVVIPSPRKEVVTMRSSRVFQIFLIASGAATLIPGMGPKLAGAFALASFFCLGAWIAAEIVERKEIGR